MDTPSVASFMPFSLSSRSVSVSKCLLSCWMAVDCLGPVLSHPHPRPRPAKTSMLGTRSLLTTTPSFFSTDAMTNTTSSMVTGFTVKGDSRANTTGNVSADTTTNTSLDTTRNATVNPCFTMSNSKGQGQELIETSAPFSTPLPSLLSEDPLGGDVSNAIHPGLYTLMVLGGMAGIMCVLYLKKDVEQCQKETRRHRPLRGHTESYGQFHQRVYPGSWASSSNPDRMEVSATFMLPHQRS